MKALFFCVLVAVVAIEFGALSVLVWRDVFWHTPLVAVASSPVLVEFIIAGFLLSAVSMTIAIVMVPRHGAYIATALWVLAISGNVIAWLLIMGFESLPLSLAIGWTADVWGYSPTSQSLGNMSTGVAVMNQLVYSLQHIISIGGSIAGGMVVWLWIRPWWQFRHVRSWLPSY